ncbi:Putative universal stress protein SAV1710 [Aerococcus viridans]|uniref:Universal stress family protein n=2 Tax=Aerococcus viridans TaxID=1377 RepID=A0AAU8U6E3_9LACT|nr:universal stress protein [Aerococcus viridans]AMC00083.1 universal stress family protein [Aerococcus viridans]EFG49465.1 universal stress family protein [Aerococcus viridans ATCC 11563 = CCUG 4311]SUU11434.1 Putative universal stress protein SAV1710 [Aerococcus viridans]
MSVSEYKKILIPVDGSDASYRAFKEAVSIAKRNDSELILLNVLDDFVRFGNSEASMRLYDDLRVDALSVLESYEAEAKEAGLENVTLEIIKGDARYGIVEFANTAKADLVVVGATGKGAIERAMMGSVSEYVVRNVKSHVLVIK